MKTHHWIWKNEDWPNFYFDASELLADMAAVSRLIGGLEVISRTINEEEQVAALERVLSDEALGTSDIEGEILRRSSVRTSIRKRLGLVSEQDDWDERADGLVSILFDSRNNTSKPLAAERLLAWHAALFPTGYSGLRKIRVGLYRGEEEMRIVSGPIGKEKVHYIAPPQESLDKEMNHFLKWVNEDVNQDVILKAGIAHLWFIMIHPFDDGNGRVGRAITDFILAQHYPKLMAIVSFSKHISLDRKGYYNALEVAGKNGLDITLWLKWFLQTLATAMHESQWIVERVAMKALFWQKHKDTSLNPRQLKVINRLLDTGEKFEGPVTTRKYAGMTKCSKVTASRDLFDLVEKNILTRGSGGGRSTNYELKFQAC
jgi:Fic family protein